MKRNDIKALHDKSVAELKKMSDELRKTIFNLKLDHTQYKLKNTSEIATKRADLARVLTVLKVKEAQQ